MKQEPRKSITIENIKDAKTLGIAIRRLRKANNLSQSDLAKKTEMIQATISGLENGRGTIESFFKIIQILKINLCLSNSSFESKKPAKQTKARSVWEKLKRIENSKDEA